jgi:hypothetical protein
VSRSPIIMVAVDTSHPNDERHAAIQRATEQILSLSQDFRLICVSVVDSTPLMDGASAAESASGIHLEHLIRLRHWVEPLRMPRRNGSHCMCSKRRRRQPRSSNSHASITST